MNEGTRPVMIMAGGTGGHVYPALAVARLLRERQVPVVWLGTRGGLEARVVPQAGIPIEWLSISGLRRKGLMACLGLPFKFLRACWQAGRVIWRLQPRVVLGMGGFVSGPGGLVCKLLQKPLVIHEQNAVAGLTNRVLAHLANSVLQAFPGTFGAGLTPYHTGNPVREEIAALPPPRSRPAGHGGPLKLLVIGGSQGAVFLNEIVPAAVATLPAAMRPAIRHQAGARQLEATRSEYRRFELEAEVTAYIEDMAGAYAWADLVVCRSGAMTVAELAAAGVASILVPYPHAVDDHQSRNARFLSSAGAAIMAPQTDLTANTLGDHLSELNVDRARLRRMAEQARHLARPDAGRLVMQECLAVAESV